MYIAVAGNIGCGKTTLTNKLAENYGWEPRFESTSDNPYLKDFYGDMERWSFPLQIFFLNHRFRQVADLENSERMVIQDRSIYEDAYVFSKKLHLDGKLNERDYANYQELFHTVGDYMKAPELLIYLRADVGRLKKQIQKRGRDYEQSIPEDYLIGLNNLYEEWISNYNQGKLLVVDLEGKDFVQSDNDFSGIITKIDELLVAESPV